MNIKLNKNKLKEQVIKLQLIKTKYRYHEKGVKYLIYDTVSIASKLRYYVVSYQAKMDTKAILITLYKPSIFFKQTKLLILVIKSNKKIMFHTTQYNIFIIS